METIYEDDIICITDLQKDWDFIATIQNKTNNDIEIIFNNEDLETITITSNNWLGLLSNEYEKLEALNKQEYYINTKENKE